MPDDGAESATTSSQLLGSHIHFRLKLTVVTLSAMDLAAVVLPNWFFSEQS